jgi:hypothetical protein
VTEAQLLARVTFTLDELDLLWHHCPDSRRCQGRRGLPDLIIAGPRGVLFAELKDNGGETSANQDRWLLTLHGGSVPYAVWRPADWESGLIEAMLRELAA